MDSRTPQLDVLALRRISRRPRGDNSTPRNMTRSHTDAFVYLTDTPSEFKFSEWVLLQIVRIVWGVKGWDPFLSYRNNPDPLSEAMRVMEIKSCALFTTNCASQQHTLTASDGQHFTQNYWVHFDHRQIQIPLLLQSTRKACYGNAISDPIETQAD
jgi:hypothetical protein